MAVYRFRVAFEDYDEVYCEIDMLSKHSFLDFHKAIHNYTKYDYNVRSSFYVSNDQWKKGKEIAFRPNEKKIKDEMIEMDGLKLSRFIDDPHQKFYYIYNFDRPYEFHVELIKILKEEEKDYPVLFKTVGNAPKPMNTHQPVVIEENELVDIDEEPDDLDIDEYGVGEDDLDFLEGEEGDDSSGFDEF